MRCSAALLWFLRRWLILGWWYEPPTSVLHLSGDGTRLITSDKAVGGFLGQWVAHHGLFQFPQDSDGERTKSKVLVALKCFFRWPPALFHDSFEENGHRTFVGVVLEGGAGRSKTTSVLVRYAMPFGNSSPDFLGILDGRIVIVVA